MALTLPTDGYGIYEDCNPNQGQGVWGPRLDQMAAGGFRVVINYGLCYGSTANMLAYINYAASKGMRVAVALHSVWASSNLSTTFPTMYVEAGSPGITAYNAFGTYVVNQVKGLSGTWGYYLADEPFNSSHTTIKSLHDTIVGLDSKPILIICTTDTTPSPLQGTNWTGTTTMYDCCTVSGDDPYPIGLAANSLTAYTLGQMAADIQSFTASKSINSAIVLQGFRFNNSVLPVLSDMQAMLHQALAHMTPQLVLWFGYYYIFGGPGGAYAPVSADPGATALWANLTQAIGTTPSRYIREAMVDAPSHLYKLDDPPCFQYGDDLITTNISTINSFVTRGQPDLLLGSWGTSQSYNGTSSAITLNTTGLPSGGASFSVLQWVEFVSSVPGAGNYPMSFGLGTDAAHEGIDLGFDGDAQRFVFLTRGVGEVQALAAPIANTRYLLGCSYDGTTAKFYVNGIFQSQGTPALNLIYGAAFIGRGVEGDNWPGLIGVTTIVNAVLPAARFLAHYNAGLASGPSVRPLGNNRIMRIG